jgi:hypothetical protein
VKTLTVRLPIAIVNDIEVESRQRQISKSDVVRERLMARRRPMPGRTAALEAIADLVGSVRGLPPDMSRTAEALSEGDALWPQASSLTPASSSRS